MVKKAAKKKITRKEYTASDIKTIEDAFEGQNSSIETSEVDEAFGGFIEAEGSEARNRSRSSTVKLVRGL